MNLTGEKRNGSFKGRGFLFHINIISKISKLLLISPSVE